ncbi:MAG: hypothetical protein U1F16_05595 [Turneriella sp.]
MALAGGALNTVSAAFTGYDPTTGFTLDSVVPVMNTVNHTLQLGFRNIPANDSIAAVPPASLVYNNQTLGFKNAIGYAGCIALTASTPTLPGLFISDGSFRHRTDKPNQQHGHAEDYHSLRRHTATGYVPPLYSPFPIAANPCSPNCAATIPNTISLVQNTSIFRSIDFSNFDVSAAVPTSATTINVTFNKIPQSAGTTSTANYRICARLLFGAELLC